MKKTVLAHSAWRIGLEMSRRGRISRIGRLDWSGGTYYEYDEINPMTHSDWRVGPKNG